MAEQLGVQVVISKHDGNAYQTVGMGETHSLKFNNALVEYVVQSGGGHTNHLGGINSCEFSFDGIFTDDAMVGEFITDLRAGNKQDLKISFVSGMTITGTFLAESIDIKIDSKDVVKFSASFKADGNVTVSNIPTA